MFEVLGMNAKNTKKLIDVASGRVKADTVIKNANVVNVFSNEIIRGDVAIVDGLIAGVGNYEGEVEIDADGRYVAPGLIDGHVHIESSMVSPGKFAETIVPRGTTTIIADPHEIANVRGLDGIRYILDASRDISLDVYIMMPSCVPATPFENSGAVLGASDLASFKDEERVLGLGELMDFYGTIAGKDDIVDKLVAFEGKIIDGHGPIMKGNELNAYASAGVRTEHECSNVEEMMERLRLGMYVQAREGSAARNLVDLLKGVTPENSRRVLFCTDDRHPGDILLEGHIDNNIRAAIKSGLDAVSAIRMATLNAAECYRIYDKGAIAPGYVADMIVVDSLEKFNVEMVFKNGVLVAKDGKALFEARETYDDKVMNTVNFKEFALNDLKIMLSSNMAKIIKLIPHSLITKTKVAGVKTSSDGSFIASSEDDHLKLAVIERHHRTGNIGLGIVEGFGLRNGAIATSVGHDSHNIIVIGDSDSDMKRAVEAIGEVGGGIAMVRNGRVEKLLPLPIAGLMSNDDIGVVSSKIEEMAKYAYDELCVSRDFDPFISLAFLALPVIPDIKLTDKGLFDVIQNKFVSIDQSNGH
jgi:adenine deaminase